MEVGFPDDKPGGLNLSNQSPVLNHPLVVFSDGGCRAYIRPQGAPENEKPELLWLNLKDFFMLKKVTKQLLLHYDQQLVAYDNPEYEITFPGWGDTETVSTLDPSETIFGKYFDDMVDDLKKDSFFVSNKTIRGAPYDFRRAPYDNEAFFDRLKQLIEETYHINGKRRVILVGHSMGCLYSVLFLKKQTVEWQKQYVKAFVSIAGPYGDNFNAFFRRPLVFRELERSFSSMYLMLPDPRLWSENETLVFTPKRNYTSRDYQSFFDDIGFPFGYQLMKRAVEGIDFFQGPTGVEEIYCVYGTSVSTGEQLLYRAPGLLRPAFPDQVPIEIFGDGDGTVNLRSAEICRHWSNVKLIKIPNSDHQYILHDPRTLKLMREVTGFNPTNNRQ
ncbi:unnamed protein product [Echinostoma caproni]|uniref:Group XV phospholipase A2 n=1 Tax=Echinostoma caproni TaxID=27848 RepID=A0A183AFK9_9TREM|nr:unnamed protein product [Echinostoma caproni]